ncbi:Glutamate 5-kinase [uncultured Paludibacter sp.]|uniref:Glutamate 5-kinase n=1 Tax=uncultured Paludibacter sp. TaxID=497635 RepID=A0A653AGV7_9BACT|nr:Glutamate 5-kinase [uncultured Paludibacter sp.]
MKFKKIAIKVGSNVLTRADGTLDITRMSAIVDQVAYLHKKGIQIVLISSGAVASGRSVMGISKKMDTVDQRQLFSTIGQAKLINHYWELFREHNIIVGQVLTTKDNFSSRRLYLNQRNCIELMLENNVIPIVNENDAVSVTELMFTDNDELSGLVASMVGAEALIILSNIDGIFTGSPSDSNSKVIREIKKGENIADYIQSSKSTFGRGGMQTKTNIARKIADEGIEVFIANGKKDNILLQLIKNESNVIYTHFVASKSEVSSVKKWIAHSDDFAKGEIHINKNAELALVGEKAVSLLPVGVTSISGNFEKDDIVKVLNENGKVIGMGKTQYSSEKAQQIIGKKNQKPIIHYDYLYLE